MPLAYHDRASVDEARFAQGIPQPVQAVFAQMKASGTIARAAAMAASVAQSWSWPTDTLPVNCSATIPEQHQGRIATSPRFLLDNAAKNLIDARIIWVGSPCRINRGDFR